MEAKINREAKSPIGVGFSYSNTSSDYTNWDDAATGHYIPQLTVLLLDYNRKPNVKPIKLKSIAVMFTLPLNYLLINCFTSKSSLNPMNFTVGESTTRS
ncbi:hypothetical protein RND71_002325 [Anisodus tanguticus]|uniref:Uncharacterized protein n=1 Tax=Anisodus tanguticus TaxID=243964 RepID=A0AAE1T2T0_9SOLA|nr:hypothetical protein RND71_002325 [Anisodus tanguticus]